MSTSIVTSEKGRGLTISNFNLIKFHKESRNFGIINSVNSYLLETGSKKIVNISENHILDSVTFSI